MLLLIAAPPMAQSQGLGNAAEGEFVFQKCYACHSVDPADVNLPGPNLAGIVGRSAGAQPGFRYSRPLQRHAAAGLVWDAETLDRYLADPEAMIPGTTMGFPGLTDVQDRADVIAYLRSARTSPGN